MRFIWLGQMEQLSSRLKPPLPRFNHADLIRYFYDGWVHLLADIDGVRLITNDVCEFLQKVPGQLIGSDKISQFTDSVHRRLIRGV